MIRSAEGSFMQLHPLYDGRLRRILGQIWAVTCQFSRIRNNRGRSRLIVHADAKCQHIGLTIPQIDQVLTQAANQIPTESPLGQILK